MSRTKRFLALSALVLTACAADAVPIEALLVVEASDPAAPVRPGDRCTLRIQPAWRSGVNCQVVVRCEGRDEDLFGGRRIGGYAVCDTADHGFTRAHDGEHVRDGDPALTVELSVGTVTWRGPNAGETATLRIEGEPHAIEPWDEAHP